MIGLVMKYFVLKPEKDTPYGRASRNAMLTYAADIESENPALARDLRAWEGKVDAGVDKEPSRDG